MDTMDRMAVFQGPWEDTLFFGFILLGFRLRSHSLVCAFTQHIHTSLLVNRLGTLDLLDINLK